VSRLRGGTLGVPAIAAESQPGSRRRTGCARAPRLLIGGRGAPGSWVAWLAGKAGRFGAADTACWGGVPVPPGYRSTGCWRPCWALPGGGGLLDRPLAMGTVRGPAHHYLDWRELAGLAAGVPGGGVTAGRTCGAPRSWTTRRVSARSLATRPAQRAAGARLCGGRPAAPTPHLSDVWLMSYALAEPVRYLPRPFHVEHRARKGPRGPPRWPSPMSGVAS
jgi:hypothetical protein